MSNEELAQHVADELRWDPKVDSDAIAISAENGVVRLRGTVGSFRQKREARRDAERIHGVKNVDNDLQVRVLTDDRRYDVDLRGTVLRALELNSIVPSTIDAAVVDGYVRLHSKAHWQFERHEAEVVASSIHGVTDVDNLIMLVPIGPSVANV